MTDFLSGLLDRALERVPVLQRRQPSVFEPTPDTPGLRSIPLGELAPGAEEATASDLEAAAFREGPVFRAPAPTTGHTMPARSILPLLEDKAVAAFLPPRPLVPSERQEGREAPQVAPPALPPRREQTAQVVVPAVSLRAVETRVVETRTVETLMEKAVEQPQPAVHSVRQQMQSSALPGVTSSLGAPPTRSLATPIVKLEQPIATRGHRDAAQKSDIGPKPARSLVLPALVPLTRLVRAASPPQPATVRETASPSPTIQVTIGRIEIRATPAAAPVRTARPVTPKLSLEDYLRSRGGGN